MSGGSNTWFFNGSTNKAIVSKTQKPFYLSSTNLKSLFQDEPHRSSKKTSKRRMEARLRHLAIRSEDPAGRERTLKRLKDGNQEVPSRTTPSFDQKKGIHRTKSIIDGSEMVEKVSRDSEYIPPPAIDLDEERREKEAMASQLALTVEEYEALDAAFGEDSFTDQAKVIEEYRKLFQEFDKDGSGAISEDELRQVIAKTGENMDEAELEELIKQADVDGDGEIDFEEFVDLMKARKRLLAVVHQMGPSNGLNSSGSKSKTSLDTTSKLSSSSTSIGSSGGANEGNLPPLKLADIQSKRHLRKYNRYYGRPTPHVLRNPLNKARYHDGPSNNNGKKTQLYRKRRKEVSLTKLRRELAISEYGIQALDVKVKENVEWIQKHCPVTSIKAQLFCQRWGIEKLNRFFQRLQLNYILKAFRKWIDFKVFMDNKEKADKYLKAKGSKKLTGFMKNFNRKQILAAWNTWDIERRRQAREEFESAAVELQRFLRGLIIRRAIYHENRRKAACTIQKIVRGRLARVLVRSMRLRIAQNTAASYIQRCYRGYAGRKVRNALFRAQLEGRSVRIIQRNFRSYQSRQIARLVILDRKRNDAAVKIQKLVRGHHARLIAAEIKNERAQQRAALLIQRVHRGNLGRKQSRNIRNEKRACVKIQSRFRGIQGRRDVDVLRQERLNRLDRKKRHLAALTIQKKYRGFKGRYAYHLKLRAKKEVLKQERIMRQRACRDIQRIYRGFRGRKRFKRLHKEKQERVLKKLMEVSAIRIQLAWRKHHGMLAEHMRLQAQRFLEEEENEACVKIQACMRGKLGRLTYQQRRRERRRNAIAEERELQAIIMIQSVIRGKLARRSFLNMKQKHQNDAQRALAKLIHEKREDAAIRIQYCARSWLARQRYVKKRKEYEFRRKMQLEMETNERAAIVIQCQLRKRRARKTAENKKKEYEEKLKKLASEQATDEIAKLKEEQERELAKLKMELIFEKDAAMKEAERMKKEAQALLRDEAIERAEEEQNELIELKMQSLVQRSHAEEVLDAKKQERDKERKEEHVLRERTKLQEQEKQKQQSEERELAAQRLKGLLKESEGSAKRKEEQKKLENHAAKEKRLDDALKRERSAIKIQGFWKRHTARKAIARMKREQEETLRAISSAEEKVAVQAQQEKALAEAKLKALLAQNEKEKELKERQRQLEAKKEGLRRARQKEQRELACKKIQCVARGYISRMNTKKVKKQIERERIRREKENQQAIKQIEEHVDEEEGDGVDEWVEYWDESAQATYYFNIRTQEASWTRPGGGTFEEGSRSNTASAYNAGGEQPGYYDNYNYNNGYSYSGHDQQQQYSDNNYYYVEGYGDTVDYEGDNHYGDQVEDEYGYYDEYGEYHYYDDSGDYYKESADETWEEYYDETSGALYYYNPTTGETRWA